MPIEPRSRDDVSEVARDALARGRRPRCAAGCSRERRGPDDRAPSRRTRTSDDARRPVGRRRRRARHRGRRVGRRRRAGGRATSSSAPSSIAEPVVTAVAEPAAKNGRSRACARASPKPKKRGSGRGDRGGRKVVGLKIGASQLAAAVVQQVDGRSELVQARPRPARARDRRRRRRPGRGRAGPRAQGLLRRQRAAAQGRAHRPREQPHRRPHDRHRRDRRRGALRQRRALQGARGAAGRGARVGARLPRPRRARERGRRADPARPARRRAARPGRAVPRRLQGSRPPAARESISRRSACCAHSSSPAPCAPRDDTATVVVSIGHEASTLLVSGGGACEFTRVFDWGGSTLQEAIAQELDVHAAEAATILRHLSLSGTPKHACVARRRGPQKARRRGALEADAVRPGARQLAPVLPDPARLARYRRDRDHRWHLAPRWGSPTRCTR